MTSTEFAKSLRLIAEFYDEHPDFPAPLSQNITIPLWGKDAKEKLASAARALAPCRKKVSNGIYPTFDLERAFGGLTLNVYTQRENVCEKVVVGEALVPAHVIPAQPAREATPEQVIEERVEPIYEWHCSSLLADAGEQGSESVLEPATATSAA